MQRWRAECGAMDRDSVRLMNDAQKESARLREGLLSSKIFDTLAEAW